MRRFVAALIALALPGGLKDMTEHVLAAYRVDLDNRMAERGEKSTFVEAHEIQGRWVSGHDLDVY